MKTPVELLTESEKNARALAKVARSIESGVVYVTCNELAKRAGLSASAVKLHAKKGILKTTLRKGWRGRLTHFIHPEEAARYLALGIKSKGRGL